MSYQNDGVTPAQRDALDTIFYGYPNYSGENDIPTPGDVDSKSYATQIISAHRLYVTGNAFPREYWTRETIALTALKENDKSVNKAFDALKDNVGKCKGLTFTRNDGRGGRDPMSISEQQDALKALLQKMLREFNQKHGESDRDEWDDRDGEGEGEQDNSGEEQDESDGDSEDGSEGDGESEGEQDDEAEPERKGDPKKNNSPDDLLAWLEYLHDFCNDRKADGLHLDEIGLRPFENGARMYKRGISIKAIKHALTLNYPPDARSQLGVRGINPLKEKLKAPTIPEAPKGMRDGTGIHPAIDYCEAVVTSGVPLALIGPKGTGKTTLARHLSERLFPEQEGKFGMVSMTSGTSPSAFNGVRKIGGDGGIIPSQFVKIYSGGGVFLFDEMDASNENLLLLVNAALANGFFANAATGELVEMHPEFYPVAGMNTMGVGAGRDYNGRNRLDAATLDRWAAGRIEINFDVKLARKVYWDTLVS